MPKQTENNSSSLFSDGINGNDKCGESSPTYLPKEETMEGAVEKLVYQNPDNFYTVFDFLPEGQSTSIKITGKFMGVQPGETLKITGRWKKNKKHGMQFEVLEFVPVFPATTKAIEKFLASGLIRGIGKVYAKRIVKKFGDDTLRIIDEDITQLEKVEGIGDKRIETIQQAWEVRKGIRELMLFVGDYDISVSVATRLYRQYGKGAIQILKNNPFQVALDVKGIGFKTADKIAEKMGIAKDSPDRADAGVLHVLSEKADEGNTFYPFEELSKEGSELLQIPQEAVVEAIKRVWQKDLVIPEKLPGGTNAVFIKSLYISEQGVKDQLERHLRKKTRFPFSSEKVNQLLTDFQKRYQFTLAEEQIQAVNLAVQGGVVVITGGPGTGKTTLIRSLLHILASFGNEVLLAAPTGRAAKRMEETCSYPSSTIHRLLKYNPRLGHFTHNETNPLIADFLIVDETSMVDIVLAYHLLKAVPSGTTLIFVGDVDQLPSVGPGNFLRDMITSKSIPVVRLTKIFRQAQRSYIITNAHRINEGQMPILQHYTNKYGQTKEIPPGREPDFYFIEREEPDEVLEAIKALVHERIPRKFHLHPVDDIQVITPMHQGLLGAKNLNFELQQLLNPKGEGIRRGGFTLRPGDKVMQTVNNYDLEVFNGDMGIIEGIDLELLTLSVRYDERLIRYDFNQLEQLMPAYATTVHKSQGSEYPAVVMPIHTQHFIMLQRNLLYTGVTRGKKLVCLVGTKKALALAVKNDKIQKRFSALAQWLAAPQKQ